MEKPKNELYQEFVDEYIEFTLLDDDTVTVVEAYNIFKVWFRTKYDNVPLPKRDEFKLNLEKMYGKMNDKLYGVKLKYNKRFIIC